MFDYSQQLPKGFTDSLINRKVEETKEPVDPKEPVEPKEPVDPKEPVEPKE